MHDNILKSRYAIKALPAKGERPHHLASGMKVHPLSYMELPFDPEYQLYNNRMTPERLNHVTDDEQYWAVRQKVILRNTGEFPVQISGPDAEKFADRVFARDVSGVKVGRCSYNFALYHNGCMINDGVLLRLAEDTFWMAQADGELTKWYMAHIGDLDVTISDPNVWVSQVQGPRAMDLLNDVIDGDFPNPWRYFDIAEVRIAGESVIITRTGFSNELGWEFYLRPENNAEAIGNRIWELGQKYQMMLTGTPVFRARRIEAGLLSHTDFGEMTTPFEAGLGHFINMDKANFVGRAALEKSNKQSRTYGMRVQASIPDRGRSLTIGGKTIGTVTSSSWSPFQQCGVAIVRLDDTEIAADSDLEVTCIDGQVHSAQLCSLPMYDQQGDIVRGKNTVIPEGPEPWKGWQVQP